MGLESAERRLVAALRTTADAPRIRLDVVGGRAARRHARVMQARWLPARPGRMPACAGRSADLVHLIGLDLPPPRKRFVATVHDLAALRFDDEGGLPAWTAELLARAERIVTPSRFTAGELGALLGVAPGRVCVVPNGPGQPVTATAPPLSAAELDALGLRLPFVLRTGGFTARKNFPVLLAAWPAVHRRTGAVLAVAGPPQAARDVQLAGAPSRDGVVVLDYVPAPLMPRLLRSATALVSTSTYEGFGLPPLEAMAAGVPVCAVRSPAVEEVCGDAALLVDDDAAALADGLVELLEDAEMRERIVSAGLRRAAASSWAAAAAVLVSLYRELDGEAARCVR